MKKLLLMAIISATLSAQISLIVGLNTSHIEYGYGKGDYEFNEDNNLIGIEYQHKSELYSVCKFENSFYNDSYSINYRHLFGSNKIKLMSGISLIKGYKLEDTLMSKTDSNKMYIFPNHTYIGNGWTFAPTVGLELSCSPHLKFEVDIISNAIINNIKYTF